MIDSFLKPIDRLIDLTKRKQIRREQTFEKIVEPFFEEFQPVAEDVIRLLRSALAALAAEDNGRSARATASHQEEAWAARRDNPTKHRR